MTINWSKIVPEDLGGYAPHFDNKELLINGVPDIEGVAGLKLTISQDKAFQIIEGASIYDNPLVFLREVLQNALDATKLQLWKDLCDDTYMAWMGLLDKTRLQTLQPYDIDSKIYDNYPITVEVSATDDNHVKIQVTDRGTGITVEDFKRMCNVGESYESSKQLQSKIQKMPNWLRPTAGFGIGLQSIFLVADKFTIDTCTGQETYHAVVYSQRQGGYLQLSRFDTPMSRGTTICIETNQLDFIALTSIRLSNSHESAQYSVPSIDPLEDRNRSCEVAILNLARRLFDAALFPLCVKSNGHTAIFTNFPKDTDRSNWIPWKNRYWYRWIANCARFFLWDKQEAVLEEFNFSSKRFDTRFSEGLFRFKEIPIRGVPLGVTHPNLVIYGMDAKGNITLSRSNFTLEGTQRIHELHNQYISVACDIILEKLQNPNFDLIKSLSGNGEFHNFGFLKFWQVCNIQQKSLIPDAVLKQIINGVRCLVLKKTPKGNVYESATIVKSGSHLSLLGNPPGQKPYEIILSPTDAFLSVDFVNYPCRIIDEYNGYKRNSCVGLPLREANGPEIIIADPIFFNSMSNSYYLKSLDILHFSTGKHQIYCKWSHTIAPIIVSPSMEKRILLSLKSSMSNFPRMDICFPRQATFAIESYSALAVDSLPDQMTIPYTFKCAWMISPFTKIDDDMRRIEHWSTEIFIGKVLTNQNFSRLVDWVEHHSIHNPPPSRDTITDTYEKLIYAYCTVATNEE